MLLAALSSLLSYLYGITHPQVRGARVHPWPGRSPVYGQLLTPCALFAGQTSTLVSLSLALWSQLASRLAEELRNN